VDNIWYVWLHGVEKASDSNNIFSPKSWLDSDPGGAVESSLKWHITNPSNLFPLSWDSIIIPFWLQMEANSRTSTRQIGLPYILSCCARKFHNRRQEHEQWTIDIIRSYVCKVFAYMLVKHTFSTSIVNIVTYVKRHRASPFPRNPASVVRCQDPCASGTLHMPPWLCSLGIRIC
jgi:hypothetical protein